VDAKQAGAMLVGEILNDTMIESAAVMASEKEIAPFGNIHTSVDFQRHLANVLTKKTLAIAVQRAGELQ